MRVAFNARPLIPREVRGWGRYTRNLVRAVVEQGIEVHLLSDCPLHLDPLGPAADKCRVHVAPLRSLVAWEQIAQVVLCLRAGVDLLHCPVNHGLPRWGPFRKVLTLHDAIERSFHDPERTWREKVQPAQLKARALHALSQAAADAIVTVSEYAKWDIVRGFGVAPDRIHVIYEAADPAFDVTHALPFAALRARYPALPARYLLYVGALERRKNLPLLLEALEREPDAPVRLVIAGGDAESAEVLRGQVRARHLEDRVRVLGWVDEPLLPSLYLHARALVYPSFQEGFGLQVVEAMRMGTPVLCADNSSLPEIWGDADTTFAPTDAAALGRLLARIAVDDAFHRAKQRHALTRSERFSWRHAAARTIAVYEEVLAR